MVTTPAPPPPSPTSSAPPPARSFTLTAGGDILIHPALTDQAVADGGAAGRDFLPLLSGVKDTLKADLSLCHLEVPLGRKEGPFFGYPSFLAPPEVAKGLVDVGYDACSTASNHTLDRGVPAIVSTLDAMDAVGLKHTGSFRTPEEAAAPLILDAGGVKVAQLSFTYGFNGIPLPEPWRANQINAAKILADARKAREAGAEVVVLSVQWGNEYQHAATAEQKALARQLLADPALDLIIGTHVHVVQPFEKIGGKWVAYGLGNEVARHAEPRGVTEEGVIARFRFEQGPSGWSVVAASYTPTLVELGPPIRLVDLTRVPATERRTQAVNRTEEIVFSLGAGDQGLVRGKP
ncbi:CapA family protein [Nocardia sp. NRRL S-836]|uniref:CapA family protein n=1 Tax=Nocardia sp. NRRL S-836 TaxID=1519492 RepID=UPI000AFF6663|nr:CapA family protein [Nocardia sp. NRRL S-836]